MKTQTARIQSFAEHAPSFNTDFLWTQKDLSILLQATNHTFMSRLTLSVTLLSLSQKIQRMPKPRLKLYYTIKIKLPIMVHLSTLLLIVDPNTK